MLQRMSSVTGFEPITLMTALAARTERIGLMFTASPTYDEPYNLVRLVGSLDHLSGGRAGWNLVTSNNINEAPNFGRAPPAHADRYARAGEFHDVVTGPRPATASSQYPCQLQDLREVTGHVVPELQRRGVFRTGHAGRRLRDHLGIPRPASRSPRPGLPGA